MIGSEEATILINCVEHDYLRKKFGVVYIRRHKVILILIFRFEKIYKIIIIFVIDY